MAPSREKMVFWMGPGGKNIWNRVHTRSAIRQLNSMGPRKLRTSILRLTCSTHKLKQT